MFSFHREAQPITETHHVSRSVATDRGRAPVTHVKKVTDFKRAVKAEAGESVVFSWSVWPSRAIRDAGNEKLKTDPRMKPSDMPFDGQRMIFGGFEVLLDTDLKKR